MKKKSHSAEPILLACGTKRRGQSCPEWAWHFRTLLALRDHLRPVTGDRARESFDAMEPPSLHAEDLVDEIYDRELLAALPQIPVEALREVEDALQRLRKGTYGQCAATGRRVPKAQLRAMPWRRCSAGKTAPVHRRSAAEIYANP